MPPLDDALDLMRGRRIAVLTGAGISTESGIPDYRGPKTRHRARNPILGRQFVDNAAMRRRYWARSLLGWPRIADAQPNAAHHALVDLERAGLSTGLITQNVDSLHTRAGSRDVVALHGRMADVRCLSCDARFGRRWLQEALQDANPGWFREVELAPDGDAELDTTEGFTVIDCPRCKGILKPDVVFFGEGVPRPRVDKAFAIVDAAEVLLVVGSSLAVFSGFRFPRHMHRRGLPVVLLNLGPTRADGMATLKINQSAGRFLPRLVTRLIP